MVDSSCIRTPAMTADQIELVKKSFDGLWPVGRKLAELFHSRFFELAPESRRLFPDSMEKQNLELMDALAAMVGALDRREIFQSVNPRTSVRRGPRAQQGRFPSGLLSVSPQPAAIGFGEPAHASADKIMVGGIRQRRRDCQ